MCHWPWSRCDSSQGSFGKQEMVFPQLEVPPTGPPSVLGLSLNSHYREMEKLQLRSSGDHGSTLVLGMRLGAPNGYSKAGSGGLMGKKGGAVSSRCTILRRGNKLQKSSMRPLVTVRCRVGCWSHILPSQHWSPLGSSRAVLLRTLWQNSLLPSCLLSQVPQKTPSHFHPIRTSVAHVSPSRA